MDHVSSLIPKVLRKRGLYEEAQASMLVFRAKKWLQETHPDAAAVLDPHALKDGILTINALLPTAQQEGEQLASELLSFLQSEDANAIREVRITRK